MFNCEVYSVRAIKPVELRNNQKQMLDLAYNGEILIVARPAQKNVVVLSEAEFNKRDKALKNAEYLAMLDRSIKQAENGEVVMYTREQMNAMETEQLINRYFTTQADKDYQAWSKTDKKTFRKINALINDIEDSGFLCGLGKPEQLRYYDEPTFSRRINKANRLVYRPYNNGADLLIIACKRHYED